MTEPVQVMLHGGPSDGMCATVTDRNVARIILPTASKHMVVVNCPIDEPFYLEDKEGYTYYRCTDGKYRRRTFGQVVYTNTGDGHFKYLATYPAEELEWQR